MAKGRPFGSTTKPQFKDFITQDEVKSLVRKAKKLAEEGNADLLKWCLDHVFGKAAQPVEGGDPNNPILVKPIYDGKAVKTLPTDEGLG